MYIYIYVIHTHSIHITKRLEPRMLSLKRREVFAGMMRLQDLLSLGKTGRSEGIL